MPTHFCTLFDRHYLTRGLVLHRSLLEACPGAELWVFCMDAQTERLLRRLALPALRIVGLPELEAFDPGLAAVKSSRNRVEYCWTATPATCLYLLAHEPAADTVTYVDADLMFFSSPEPLLAELGEGSILLTRQDVQNAADKQLGRFCVQFLPFRRDANGLAALRWWRERCLEWCYARVEDGRFGDQAYLDDWPERFRGVRVLRHPGVLAPWDVVAHRLERRGDRILVDGEPLIFFHFAALWLYRGPLARLGRAMWLPGFYRRAGASVWGTPYPVRRLEHELLWTPYVRALAHELAKTRCLDRAVDDGAITLAPGDVVYQIARGLLPPRARVRLAQALPERLWPLVAERYRRG